MAAKITDEMRNEIAAHPGEPVTVLDDQGHKVYYLVEENTPLLRALIQEGIDSPKVPAEQAHARLRKKAVELSQSDA